MRKLFRFMQELIEEIKEEHIQIRKILVGILGLINTKKLRIKELKARFHELGVLWNVHEAKEDHIFNHMSKRDFPEEKSLIEQHRELRGHWKVLNDALDEGKDSEIRVSIDTDGKMLAEKFISHIDREERYFSKLKG